MPKTQVEIKLTYYAAATGKFAPNGEQSLRLYQTIIYGNVQDQRARRNPSESDFMIIKNKDYDFAVADGGRELAALRIKTRVIDEAKKRMAAYSKKLRNGTHEYPKHDKDTFMITV